MLELDKPILKFAWKKKFPQVAKTRSLKNESKGGNLTLPDFKAYYKV